jgi:hypothetical protein
MPWGRVGSNLLLDALGASPFIVCENEPLTRIRSTSPDPDAEQKAWYVRSRLDEEGGPVRVVNLSIRSIVDHDHFLERFADERDAAFFFLDRRNLAHVVLSVLKARHYAETYRARHGRATWAVRAGEEIELTTPVDVDLFMEMIAALERDRAVFDAYRARLRGTDIYYTDLALSLPMVVEEVCGQLALPVPAYTPRMVKAIRRPYREEFAGYDSLAAHVARVRPDLARLF